MASRIFDVVVVGGGIIGTAISRELLKRNSSLKLAIVEKEKILGAHQSGHNSGVIHSGIYYTPGSLKAKLCIEGLNLAYKYCDEKGIPYKKCGKLIVAIKEDELPKLDNLLQRGKKNGVKNLALIKPNDIKEIEPNCTVLNCKYVVTCAGLFSDKLAKLSGCSSEPAIIPIRGDYLQLRDDKKHIVKTNIYTVPDIRLPFLDVHFTPRVDGNVWIGPNAIVALKREGYKITDCNFSDLYNMIFHRGFQRLALKHWSYGVQQLAERINTSLMISRLQKYVPALTKDDVIRGSSGVRAQAISRTGELIDDFCFDSGIGLLGEKMFHVRNAPSPAATSSLAIANYVATKIEEKFQLKNLCTKKNNFNNL